MPSHWICCNKKLNYIVEIITCFLSVQQCSIASRVASFRVLLLPFKAQWRFAHAHHAHDKRPSRSHSLSSRPPSSFSHLRGRSSPSVECHTTPPLPLQLSPGIGNFDTSSLEWIHCPKTLIKAHRNPSEEPRKIHDLKMENDSSWISNILRGMR